MLVNVAAIALRAGYVQEVMLDFSGDEDTSDVLSKADRDMTPSQMLAIRLFARGALGVSAAELRKTPNAS